jgi:uncharacterized protein (TIGR03067 family)
VALGSHEGGFGGALGWLCTPESMPSICLVYAFVVALYGFVLALHGCPAFAHLPVPKPERRRKRSRLTGDGLLVAAHRPPLPQSTATITVARLTESPLFHKVGQTKGNCMKHITRILSLAAIAAMLGASGCSTLHKSDSATLQGAWEGQEIGVGQDSPHSLVFSGKNFDFRGEDPRDWGKGTFILREDTQPKQLLLAITECGVPKYNGMTTRAIYRIEDRTLTLAGNEPGDPAGPSSFDASGTRRFVLKKE